MGTPGPKAITLYEYFKRITKIPPTTKPKRRSGFMRRERAVLIRLINQDPSPNWNQASAMWEKIDRIDLLKTKH
ncbi:hypothetical protein FF38_01261 [Lucilia cuprina]|uniref:Uncharacterized protein n=1 Tax=Lucilia cuprina TaxID=7375 RepID=A0A0L0BZ89_LUCCU|nr:hypothetical protein CVS40_11583 [Lucilia cuprina]KNC25345.1 hypothetical protein FF38_01261 [Lucilia cuprina]